METYDRAQISGNLDQVRASLEDWVLPTHHGSWAYANGTLAYSFEDEYGDGACGFWCGRCADGVVRDALACDGAGWVKLTALVTSEPDLYCDSCGIDLSN